ncbi:MAG: glycerol acyltransferase, partial [Ardenticatenaceae bacterium]
MAVTQNRFFRGAARFVLALFGWKPEGELPALPKFVLVGAPHTSNWDWALMLFFGAYFGIKPFWMGKKALFPRPIRGVMRWLGGIP